MSTVSKKPLALRVLKFMLGSDEPSFAVAAAAACLAIGMTFAVTIVGISDRPVPPFWQVLGLGLFFGLFLMPFFFMSVSRALLFMSPPVGLATMTAAGVLPAIMMTLNRYGIAQAHPLLFAAGCLAFVPTMALITRWIVKRG